MSAPSMSRRGLLGLLRPRDEAPARREPARGEPARREPARGEPARGEPARGEPAPEMVDASEADETPPPWVARERARVLAQETRRVARIAPFACIAASGCSVCSERCPEPGAIALARGRPVVEASLCTGCGACHEACPAPLRAIQLLPVLPARP